MEINFMIFWKKNVKDKKDISTKVKKMISDIFPETDEKYINTTFQNEEYQLPYKISSQNDEIIYLKIEHTHSEIREANILSFVRDNLYRSNQHCNFSIICTYDEASLTYCCKLMKPFGIFERKLREIMYLTTVKAFGYKWVAETFPSELIAKIKEKTHGCSDEKITEIAFEYLDYNDIIEYLFSETRNINSIDEVLDVELSDAKLNKLNKTEIINIIKKTRKASLWERMFATNNELPKIKDEIEYFRIYRNDIMHHHKMDHATYREVQKRLQKTNKQLCNAILIMEERIYSKEEYEIVLPNLSQLAYRMIEAIGSIYDSSIINSAKAALETMAKVIGSIAESSIVKSLADLAPLISNLPQVSQIGIDLLPDTKQPIKDDFENQS